MSTPPNPPSAPAGPPTEPEGTPIPETDSIPAPAQPLSLEKTPVVPEQTPVASEASATSESPATPVTSDSAVAPGTPEDDAAAPEAPADAAAPEAPAAPAPEPPAAPAAATPAPSPFAPPSPTPAPAAPAPDFGAPGVPADVWGAPAPGYTGAGAPYGAYPQAAPPGNGLAIAALVVSGFGILLAIIPFLFWAGGVTAAVGVGLGIGGIVRANKGAPHKPMAVVGTVLGVAGMLASVGGFFLTAMVVDRASDRLDQQIEDEDWGHDLEGLEPSGEPWPSKSPSPSQVPGLTSALPFGETFTYPNGVKVSLSAPKKYEPKGIVARERIENAIQITVTITNGSTSPHEVIYAMPNVRDDKGMTADTVYDSSGNVPKLIRGSILPGESASGVVAFEVPEGTKSVTADISAGTMLDDIKYAGPIG
ncbi:DUF4352 domain-containing protein [Streptomyces avidinii]|uniref:DUF4352 domain-containing protein n=1 Tax=Streptomyces avidinii TaxID=1895 RepID=A0ABS4L249_STRAV|nr:DUF4352 domain-containing protein [Streptomyces avidinii]MBP2036358.1 hypothetical protein [Streptomyces avidinii]GGY82174.1 hypothetical protein GCM10010343_03620 [Streptomyces avidinii]